MRQFDRIAAQGDLLIQRIESLPQNLEEMHPENNNFVVGHSETGHHHTISQNQAKVYRSPQNLFILFVVVDESAELRHLRDYDQHESLELKEGIYQINQQREYTHKGFRRAQD